MSSLERLRKEHFLSNRYGTENEEVCDCGLDAHQCDALVCLTEIRRLETVPDWWYCVWCGKKYPYEDTVDVLKSHSSECLQHPGNIKAITLHRLLDEYLNGGNHDHCDEDGGGTHSLDREWWEEDVQQALKEATE